ncbi:hypothetical protein CYMTET_51958 [Cymbomonas tetramitiformis]|uniref:Uncharacterized protein n=1 Tax=Cymbomonas tetramitiformis TaxID=36881 RepID=A0AAE0BLE0_9CHLO|nr:hypothetical protein CYMTET_51958 [Cymbomonas tetramitiformis]
MEASAWDPSACDSELEARGVTSLTTLVPVVMEAKANVEEIKERVNRIQAAVSLGGVSEEEILRGKELKVAYEVARLRHAYIEQKMKDLLPKP